MPVLNVPADIVNKTQAFYKQYKCLVMERRDAGEYESASKQNTIKCNTDGCKLNGRAGASFYI